MEEVKRIQALARLGFSFALGALVLGVIGFALSWLAPAEAATGVPVLVVGPGVCLLVAAIFLIITAVRIDPPTWPTAYRLGATILFALAGLSILSVIFVGALFLDNGYILQLILVALVALQAPVALTLVGRTMARIAGRQETASTTEN